MPLIRPADCYEPADDFWIVASYFNSAGFRSKLANFELFRERIERSGLSLLTIECAFGDRPFELASQANVLHMRGRDVMWQKERLLNVAMAALPPECKKVAWLDADILFERSDWAVAASKMLDEFPVLQLFDHVVRLPRGQVEFVGDGDTWESFASVCHRDPQLLLRGDFAAHGHSGFAWAA